jgi:hypothetical protein
MFNMKLEPLTSLSIMQRSLRLLQKGSAHVDGRWGPKFPSTRPSAVTTTIDHPLVYEYIFLYVYMLRTFFISFTFRYFLPCVYKPSFTSVWVVLFLCSVTPPQKSGVKGLWKRAMFKAIQKAPPPTPPTPPTPPPIEESEPGNTSQAVEKSGVKALWKRAKVKAIEKPPSPTPPPIEESQLDTTSLSMWKRAAAAVVEKIPVKTEEPSQPGNTAQTMWKRAASRAVEKSGGKLVGETASVMRMPAGMFPVKISGHIAQRVTLGTNRNNRNIQ